MGIYETQDDAKTWILIPVPVPQSSNGYQYNSLAVDFRNPNIIFFGDDEGEPICVQGQRDDLERNQSQLRFLHVDP